MIKSGRMEREQKSLSEVVCLVFYKNGKVLLEQRLEADNFQNRWTFTGGKVDQDDFRQGDNHIITASRREGWEETGLRANQCLPFTSFAGVSRNGNSYLFHGVWIKDWDGEMDENKEPGVRRLEWVPLQRATEYIGDTEVDKKILEHFLAIFNLT